MRGLSADFHREVESRVIVVTKADWGRQSTCQMRNPRLASRLSVHCSPQQTAKPSNDIRVDQHSTLVPVQTEVCAGGIRSDPGQLQKFLVAVGDLAAAIDKLPGHPPQQRQTPSQTEMTKRGFQFGV